MHIAPRNIRVAAVALAAASALAVGLSPTADAGQIDRYVNLGDSYSAGSGVLPVAPGMNPLCMQSAQNWAKKIASAKGYAVTDVSCGGAQTKDLYQAQYSGLSPQLDAVTKDTDLVTLTMGGNDNNTFIGAVLACGSAGIATGGFGSPCKTLYGETFANDIRNKTYPAIVKGLNDIRAKAPRAKVVVSGYPWIVPTTGGCFPQMPIASGDVPYLRSLQTTLNDAVKQAAAATGATYIDVNGVSDGHDACKPVGVRWIEPAVFTTQFVPVHPNALGEQGMANAALAQAGL